MENWFEELISKGCAVPGKVEDIPQTTSNSGEKLSKRTHGWEPGMDEEYEFVSIYIPEANNNG